MIRHGEGTSTWTKPFKGQYKGEWKNDMYHGLGTYNF